MNERRSGRTMKMVRAIDARRRPILVVHTAAMKGYLEQMLRDLRLDIKPPLQVRVVTSMHDVDRLRFLDFEVDHAAMELLPPEVREALYRYAGRCR